MEQSVTTTATDAKATTILHEMLGDQYQIQSLTDIGCHEEIVEKALT